MTRKLTIEHWISISCSTHSRLRSPRHSCRQRCPPWRCTPSWYSRCRRSSSSWRPCTAGWGTVLWRTGRRPLMKIQKIRHLDNSVKLNLRPDKRNWDMPRKKLTSIPRISGVAAAAKSDGTKNTEDYQECPHGVRPDFEARLELKCICVRFISPPVTSSTSPTSCPLASEVELCPRYGTCC